MGIMNKKLLNGILVGLGIVVMIAIAFQWGMTLALAFWIYVGVMVRKRKRIFNDTMEPGLAEKLLKGLKTFAIVADILFLIAIAGILLHNVLSGLYEIEEPISFFIGVGALWVFIIASAGGLVTFLKGRQQPK